MRQWFQVFYVLNMFTSNNIDLGGSVQLQLCIMVFWSNAILSVTDYQIYLAINIFCFQLSYATDILSFFSFYLLMYLG
jgi:hypothetical protein